MLLICKVCFWADYNFISVCGGSAVKEEEEDGVERRDSLSMCKEGVIYKIGYKRLMANNN